MLVASGGALALLTVLSATIMLWDGRQASIRDWRHTVANLATTLAAHAEQTMNAADLVLNGVFDRIADAEPRTVEDIPRLFGTAAVQAGLHDRIAGVPQVDVASIVTLDGRVVNFSRTWPVPPIDLSDRDYVKALSAGPISGTFLSAPVQNRGTGTWTFYLARQIRGEGGRPIGIAIVGIGSRYFQDFYKAANIGDFSAISLFRNDGVLLAQEPHESSAIGRSFAGEPSFLSASTAETILLEGPQTGPRGDARLRIIAPRPLTTFPLLTNVTVTEEAILGTWRRTAINVGLLAFAFVAAIVAATLALLRLFEQQDRTLDALLRARNDAEEAAAARSAVLERLRASEARLNEKSDVLELTLDHIDQGLLMIDGGKRIAVHNQRVAELLDVPPALLAGKPLFSELVDYQRARGEFVAARITATHVPGAAQLMTQRTTYERTRPNGRILEVQTVPLPHGGMVRTFTDITQRRQSEQQVRHLAHHDNLTQLFNRLVFQRQLADAIELADRRHSRAAVLYLDLDGFKTVNDTHGHAVGDQLLIEVAARLLRVVRSGDTVARMGGDEFAILQPLVERRDAAENLARRILGTIAEPYVVGELRCTVGVSIGIALYPDHARSAEEMLTHADVALYRAKAGGKGMLAVFDEVMDRRQQNVFQQEQELKEALPADQFFLEYQPIVDAETRSTVCFEALLRWRHPHRGVVGPIDFIEMAERSGLIVPLGLWVLQTACTAATDWPARIGVAVNVSPIQFTRADLVAQVRAALDHSGLDPARLTLEVTEGVMLEDTEAVITAMTTLRAMGVRFSLDDFGTAQSRLTYLRRFPFDVIKIDKSFVQHAIEEEGARAIVGAVVAIGHAFRLSIIAEGIERDDQITLLRSMGCHMLQGYLLGRPTASTAIPADG